MAAFMRCSGLKQRNLGQSLIGLFSLSNHHVLAVPAIHRCMATATQDKKRIVDQVHRKLDYSQGVSSDLFKLLYSSVEKTGPVTDQDVSLLLHVCSVGPFDAPTQKRTELAEDVWNKLEQLGVTPTTRLYNSKLKVYCANKRDFNPLDELLQMKSMGLNPDKITFGLLVEGFCQKGDIAGANDVLEAMKTEDYTLGVGIFNSFITGHLKAGSPEKAEEVLEVLRSRGLTPNQDTYFRFAVHYAEQGDEESLLKYINQAADEGVTLDHSQLLEIYRVMVASGHSNQVGQLLKLIAEKGIFRVISMNTSCHLASEGFNDAAWQLYNVIPKIDEGKVIYNAGSFLLKAMIINGQSAEAVMQMADKIVEVNPKAVSHRNALLYAYKAGSTDLAVQLLELMKAKNHHIKVPHIVPAICSYRNNKNLEGLYKTTSLLLELDHSPEDKVDQLRRCAYPALVFCGNTREDIVSKFKDHEKTWNTVFFLDDLNKEGCATALKNATGKELDGTLLLMSDVEEFINKHLPKEWEATVEVLEYVRQQTGGKGMGGLLSVCGGAVRKMLMQKDWETLDKFLTAMADKKLALRAGFKQMGLLSQVPDEIRDKIHKLCDSPVRAQRQSGPYLDLGKLEAMSKEELEDYQKQEPSRFLPRIALLNKAISAGDLDEIKLRLRELQAVGFQLNIVQLLKVVGKCTQLGDVESALQYFEELKKLTGTSYRDIIPLDIAAAQVKAGNIAGAVEMIESASESTFPKDERFRYPRLSALRTILEKAPTLDDAALLHSAIFKSKTIVPENDEIVVHAAYVSRVLAEDDDDELVHRLTKLHEECHVFPSMDRVLVRFIEKQDVERLKKVMDLGISVFGSSVFHHKLAINLLQCGMPSRAATILQTPGLRVKERVLMGGARYFVKTKRVDCLEALVEITKDMPVSKAQMLGMLIEGYVGADDLKKATDVLQQFTDSFIEPTKATIDLLVQAHLSRNLEMPENLQAYATKTKKAASKKDADESSSSSSESGSDSESSSEEIEKPESLKEEKLEESEQRNTATDAEPSRPVETPSAEPSPSTVKT